MSSLGELDAAVEDDDLAAVLDGGHVLADLADVRGLGHRVDGLRPALPHSATFIVGPLEAYLDAAQFYSLPVAAWNAGMRTAVFCIVLLLLAEVRQLIARLQQQSHTDELTGVDNRRAFLLIAAREIERSRRYEHELSLAYLDIDGFKAVNDRYGHVVGDRVLFALAGLARATARSVDSVARLGGDEFAILMPETDAEAALPLAERLREACSRAAGSDAARVTCSIGLATFERAPKDVEELLMTADALMYEAKAAGGDGVRHARVGEDAPTSARADWCLSRLGRRASSGGAPGAYRDSHGPTTSEWQWSTPRACC